MANPTLKVGDKAPSFTVTDVAGRKVKLRDYSNSYVLVAFLRFSACPWCNLAVHRLAVEEPLLKDNGCKVIALIQSPKTNIEQNIFERHKLIPKYPIVADPDMEIYKKYHVTPSIFRGLKHAVMNMPAWVTSVYKEGYKQTAVDGELFMAPAMFLISRGSQKIVRVDYDSNLYDHESFTRIYDSIADHQIHGFEA